LEKTIWKSLLSIAMGSKSVEEGTKGMIDEIKSFKLEESARSCYKIGGEQYIPLETFHFGNPFTTRNRNSFGSKNLLPYSKGRKFDILGIRNTTHPPFKPTPATPPNNHRSQNINSTG
jgi:hypothetical protein